MKKYIALFAAAVALASCAAQPEQTPAEKLMAQINAAVEQGKILFGHQDDYMYGHSWKVAADEKEYKKSDVYDIVNAYPAVYGMDLGGIELGDKQNLDQNNFDQMRASAAAHYERGGIVTFSWHPRNPLTGGDSWDFSNTGTVASILPGGEKHELFMTWLQRAADFMGSIKTSDGQTVPVIFRPWHEHTGSWFWWGQDICTKEQYLALWKMTYDYMMVERGMTNLVWAYSPNVASKVSVELFEDRYPGDDMVDLIGFDSYQYGGNEGFIKLTRATIEAMLEFAKVHNKPVALTETGYEGVKYDKWWTEVLYETVKGYPLAYVLTWRNACDKPEHFYGPWPGHASAEDFKTFAAKEDIVLLGE